MFPPPTDGDPCQDACDASALCVRSAGARAVTCLCPDGLVPSDTSTDKNLTCVISRSTLESGASPAGADNATCALSCGAGTCSVRGGSARCVCGALYGGARCQHYRCARHCLHRGVCVLQPHPPPHIDPPPLKCICVQGYTGSRCETPPPATSPSSPSPAIGEGRDGCSSLRCVNGGECRQPGAAPHCVCPSQYYGLRCEQCVGGPACGADAVCTAGLCRADTCAYCLNQGVCVSTGGGVTCECPAGWSGERCQRRACSDAGCKHIGGGAGGGGGEERGNDVQPARGGHAESDDTGCSVVQCQHGGRCVVTRDGAVCACAGAWGGVQCALYVGHDHACLAACRAPALCLWGPDLSETEAGPTYCACPLGETCPLPPAPAPGPSPASPKVVGVSGGGAGGAWLAATLSLLTLAALVGALIYLLHRRRHGLFVHARLSDNVEISNPMYLAGEDDEPPSPSPHPPRGHPHTHPATRTLANGGNHFANPVYESMYAPQQNMPIEEHANLLSEGGGDASPPPAERAALL